MQCSEHCLLVSLWNVLPNAFYVVYFLFLLMGLLIAKFFINRFGWREDDKRAAFLVFTPVNIFSLIALYTIITIRANCPEVWLHPCWQQKNPAANWITRVFVIFMPFISLLITLYYAITGQIPSFLLPKRFRQADEQKK